MGNLQSLAFNTTRKLLLTLTGNGSDRGAFVNDLHHKLSYRLHKILPSFGIAGEVKIAIPGLPGHSLRMIAEDGGVAHQFLVYGTYEPYESSLVDQYVKPGMVVYNIGANIGYYTIRTSLLAGEKGAVYAFEPSKDNFRLLEKNIEENGLKNVHGFNAAVAEKRGVLKLYMSGTNSGDHQIFATDESRSFQEIAAFQLDGFIETEPAPDVIIMDVQGAEYSVLKGFERYLTSANRKPFTLFLEFSPAYLRASGSSPENLLALLRAARLSINLIDEKQKTVQPIAEADLLALTTGTKEQNLLCLPL